MASLNKRTDYFPLDISRDIPQFPGAFLTLEGVLVNVLLLGRDTMTMAMLIKENI